MRIEVYRKRFNPLGGSRADTVIDLDQGPADKPSSGAVVLSVGDDDIICTVLNGKLCLRSTPATRSRIVIASQSQDSVTVTTSDP